MRAGLINTGTELLLGDVQGAHLAFIAHEIFPLGLRIEERRTVPDTDAIGRTLAELFPSYVMPLLQSLAPSSAIEQRVYKVAGVGESSVEEAIGEKVLAIPGIELGYCARPGEVDVRIIGKPEAIQQADAVIQSALGPSIFS